MTSRRVRRSALVACIILAIPILLWLGIVLVAPTSWAKGHLIAALEARTHRLSHIDGLSVDWLGGIGLTNLEIGSPRDIDDPWLKAANIHFHVNLFQLIRGRFEPTSVEVDGADIRVLRRDDGALELADLLDSHAERKTGFRAGRAPTRLDIQIHSGALTLIDEGSKTRLRFQNIEGQAVREGRHVLVPWMRGILNGGPFTLVGEFDRTTAAPHFDGRFRAEDVLIDDGMTLLRYAVPVLAGTSVNLKGRLAADLLLKGQGASWPQLRESLAGKGVITINPIDLDGAPLVAELSKVAELTRRGGIASVHSDFVIKDQRISTDTFSLEIGRVPMTLSGWTGFDGLIDYRINLSGLNRRIPEQARQLLGELNVNLQSLQMLTLQGSVDKMVVRLNGVSLDRRLVRDRGIKREDREKLRMLGRKLLDDLVR